MGTTTARFSKMRFACKTTTETCARLGQISEIERLKDFTLATPHVLLHTSGGTVPHLTHEVLQKVTQKRLGLHLPLTNILHMENRMSFFDGNVAEFIGMKEYFTLCSITDPGIPRLEGFNCNNYIAVMSRSGKKNFNAKSYVELIEKIKPDLFVMLNDNDTTVKSSKKRLSKSVHRTVQLFNEGWELFHQSSKLGSCQILGALVGGYSFEEREYCSKEIGTSSAFGVIIDGLDKSSNKKAELKIDDVKSMIEASLKYVTDDKLRIIPGCWNPKVVLELISLGVDLLDTSYPALATKQNRALIFLNDDSALESFFVANDDGDGIKKCDEFDEPAEKKSRLVGDKSSIKSYFSLDDPVHAESFIPISDKCSCLTCQKHTRAYIHHLITVKELLGPVLLMIHNLHHYLQFFEIIRKALQTNRFNQLRKNFEMYS